MAVFDNNSISPEERKEKAAKAGKASGKARRKKKELKKLLELALSQPQADNTEEDNYTGITVALVNEALSGNVKAFEVIRDTIGQKPVEKIEQKVDTNIVTISITDSEDATN